MEVRIGLEIHLQLKTQSKMFCRCRNDYQVQDDPNTNICPVCLGYPGTLPVTNRRAVEYAIRLARVLHSDINPNPVFYRKNYFYPDLPKGYQITQYNEAAIAQGGYLPLDFRNRDRKVRIRRLSLEEDTARSIQTDEGEVLLDFNRAGIPLIEIVTEPDMHTVEDVRKFLENLRMVVQLMDISDADMEKGQFRVDINVSVGGGERVEIKNVNSIRDVVEALRYEINRQKEELKKGNTIRQHTRRWDDYEKRTIPMRRKETEDDYRYFPEPDIPVLSIAPMMDEVQSGELDDPFALFDEMAAKVSAERKGYENYLSNLEILMRDRDRDAIRFFRDAIADEEVDPMVASKWMINQVRNMEALPPLDQFKKLMVMVQREKLPAHKVKDFLRRIIEGAILDELLRELEKGPSDEELEVIVRAVIEEHPDEFQRLKGGKKGLIGFFIGRVKKKNPQADPGKVKAIIEKIVEE